MVTRGGETVPRPMGSALYGTKPSEVLHCDFIYMGSGNGELRYKLILLDDMSSYTWLWPVHHATAEVLLAALSRWIASCGTMKWLVTDQRTHFRNLWSGRSLKSFALLTILARHARHGRTDQWNACVEKS